MMLVQCSVLHSLAPASLYLAWSVSSNYYTNRDWRLGHYWKSFCRSWRNIARC